MNEKIEFKQAQAHWLFWVSGTLLSLATTFVAHLDINQYEAVAVVTILFALGALQAAKSSWNWEPINRQPAPKTVEDRFSKPGLTTPSGQVGWLEKLTSRSVFAANFPLLYR